MRVRFFRRSIPLAGVALTLALAGGLPTAGRADIQNPGRSSFPGDRRTERQGERPASAVAQTVSVVEGGTVTIILRARGHAGEMIDFFVRTPPAHGTLEGDPRQIMLNAASVAYTHRPGDNATEDAFTYAVQTRGSPVSAEQRVTVRIQEPPPVLAVSPGELDFGAVKAGESTRAQLTLANQGGGEAAGRVEPPPPWVVDGPVEYRLPRGASQTFSLVFKPQGERAYADALHFRYETGGGVRLVGTGLAGPGGPSLAGGPGDALAAHPLSPRAGLADGGKSPAPTVAAAPPKPAVGPVASGPSPGLVASAASLEPAASQGGMPSMPSAASAASEADDGGVTGFEIRARGRTTLDLNWRAPNPPPKSYRVEMRYLSLDPDDRLVVDWRPYAQVEFAAAHGFVNARLSGLSVDSQQCLRVVAVDAAGRLTTPSPLLVTYTLPASTWWRPTPLKVLFGLLLLCGGLVVRQRWETGQLLREIDASRRHRTAMG